MDKRSRSTY